MRRADVTVELGPWETLRAQAAPIRTAVFVEEQRVPAEIEIDEFDPVSLHAIARDREGRALGTGRLLPDGHIGRLAVLR
jgi:predicted GNAT family N-acyltransferase